MELLSEEEQWERMKAWVRTNGLSVLMLTALLLLGWFGWRWWQDRAQTHAATAGTMYQSVLDGLDAGRDAEAFALIESLRSEYPKSAYVYAADMIAANVHVANNELDKALERLQRVASGSPDEYLRPIARLRVARVQAAQGNHDAALATLGTASMGLHDAARLEVRGDVLLAKGDRAGALQEYQAAREALPAVELEEGGVAELVDLKIADLSSARATGEPAAEAVPAEAAPAAAAPVTEATP